MKFSNQELLKNIQEIGHVSQKELPVKVSYAIAKNISKIESELKIYGKEREKLIDKYAQKVDGKPLSDKNDQIIFKPECKEDWDKDIKALLDIESDINVHKFSFSELNGFKLSAADLMAIDYMIDEK
ncbi:hypothetical protein [Clostridium pasteurianum]|uniref:Uncharacterized protein n=1 Tax=Clostridium pasteurianum BC1 TaxID=86416 RepID=R4JZA9_CLOPA|nr:hypothetical protein [Clostridium pasteurianum]AGK95638.1 hypothetical protein Clopa_0590 [Clostridium pasteurianum BC1]